MMIVMSEGTKELMEGYIGVKFAAAGGDLVGAIRFGANGDASEGTIYSWAYDDSGDPFHCCLAFGTGPVPEPSGLALLAMGAAGLANMRKKRERA